MVFYVVSSTLAIDSQRYRTDLINKLLVSYHSIHTLFILVLTCIALGLVGEQFHLIVVCALFA